MDGQSDRLLTPGEVAALFRVDPKTVTRWAASGRISSIRTPGGHRRYREVEIRALLGIDASELGCFGVGRLSPTNSEAEPFRFRGAIAYIGTSSKISTLKRPFPSVRNG